MLTLSNRGWILRDESFGTRVRSLNGRYARSRLWCWARHTRWLGSVNRRVSRRQRYHCRSVRSDRMVSTSPRRIVVVCTPTVGVSSYTVSVSSCTVIMPELSLLSLFSFRSYAHLQVLLVDCLLAKGYRTTIGTSSQ
jgi:hypothetical protein